MKHTLLGVNIDHIATVRQARRISYPDPVQAAILAEEAGADGITLHLREDRRHIQDRDVYLIREVLQTRMNLEMAATEEMVKIAEKVKPTYCCIVPEKREEITTEGGLDVVKQKSKIKSICERLKKTEIEVSLFIAPDKAQIDAAIFCKAPIIEIHTGNYAESKNEVNKKKELKKIITAAKYARSKGLIVNAGHGLNYQNVQAIADIAEITELNIGHSIIARALFVGIKEAVREMKKLIKI